MWRLLLVKLCVCGSTVAWCAWIYRYYDFSGRFQFSRSESKKFSKHKRNILIFFSNESFKNGPWKMKKVLWVKMTKSQPVETNKKFDVFGSKFNAAHHISIQLSPPLIENVFFSSSYLSIPLNAINIRRTIYSN